MSTNPVFQMRGLTVIRSIIAFFLVYDGWDVFDKNKMNEYITRDVFRNSSFTSVMVYLGKTPELVAGFLLAIGLFTRIDTVIIISIFIYIPFFAGNVKTWYEDQYLFLFVLFGCVFFLAGPGKCSVDHLLPDKNKIVEN